MATVAIFLLLVGALAGGFVTGLAGFGTALMALGIWLYVLPPSTAVPLALTFDRRPDLNAAVVLAVVRPQAGLSPFLIGGLAGVPVGTLLVAHADPRVFKLSVGVLLLVFPPRSISTENPWP